MTINIQLDPSVFLSGGLFEGIPRNRAVLHIGVGRDDVYIGKLNGGTAANLSYRGGQTNFMIGTSGTDISDITLEYIVSTGTYKVAYAVQLIDMMERSLVIVSQDGTPLTATEVQDFTA